jgi:hypothetical protein
MTLTLMCEFFIIQLTVIAANSNVSRTHVASCQTTESVTRPFVWGNLIQSLDQGIWQIRLEIPRTHEQSASQTQKHDETESPA